MKFKGIILILTILFVNNSFSQSHTLDISTGCRLAKPVKGSARNEGKNCPACVKESEAERIAKKEEDARVYQQAKEKEAKLKLEREKALAEQSKKIADEREAQKNNELVVTNNSSSVKTSNKPTNVERAKITDNTIFASGGGGYSSTWNPSIPFKNEKGEIIIDNPDWSGTYIHQSISFTDTSYKNFGIVRIGDKYFVKNTYNYNFINAKGEFLINNDSIISCQHIRDDWYLIQNKQNNHYLLNLETKKEISLPTFATKSIVSSAWNNYVPVFSDKIVLNTSYSFSGPAYGNGVIESNNVKKEMMKHFPNQVNEEILSRYRFVLFNTDYKTTLTTLNNYSRLIRDNHTHLIGRIEMYGITEKGEMEVIRVK